MNFNFLPCHFVFYDSIFIFGILETPPKSLASFRLIFVFIPIFRIFNIKKLLKITSRARIHFPLSSYDFFHFSLPTHKKTAQNVKVEFCPPRQLLALHCSGCGAQIALTVPWPPAEKHKLPMDFIFCPCHFQFYDPIIHFGILETTPQSFKPFQSFFLFFSIFPFSDLRKIIKNHFHIGFEFRFFLSVPCIFLYLPAKNHLKIS